MDGILSFPAAAGPRRWPEGQLSPRAGSRNRDQSAVSQWEWSFNTLWGGFDPEVFSNGPLVVGGVEIWKGF